MVNRAAIDKLFEDITDPSLLTYIAMKLDTATDNSDNDHQGDDVGDWKNIDDVRGEQEWDSESEEHHDRKRTVISLDDTASGSDSHNEVHKSDEDIHIQRHTQKKIKIKMEQKTWQLQCKKRKKTTIEAITLEHRYKARKTNPGNSGPPRD